MVTSISFNLPNIWPQQATSVFTQQTTGISVNIANLMNLMLPVMVIGMMMKMMGSSLGKKKEVEAADSKSANPRAKKVTAR